MEALRGFVARLTHGLELSAAVAKIRFVTFRGPLKFLQVLERTVGAGTGQSAGRRLFFVRLTAHANGREASNHTGRLAGRVRSAARKTANSE